MAWNPRRSPFSASSLFPGGTARSRSRTAAFKYCSLRPAERLEEAPEGGFTASAIGKSIFTEADSAADLHEKIRDAVRCHFNPGQAPRIIRLHFVREEVITA